jgi:hypothetical protein
VHELSRRSLPFTSDGFGFAADLLNNIVRGRLSTNAVTREAAGELSRRFEAVVPYFRDAGLFCTFAGWPEEWNPTLLLGPPLA